MNPELLIAREIAGALTPAEAGELAAGFDPKTWLEDRRMDALIRTQQSGSGEFLQRLAGKLSERATTVRLLKQSYFQSIEMAAHLRSAVLSGLTREQLLWSPRPDMPPALWHAAHLAITDAIAWLGAWKGEWTAIDGRWLSWFAMGSAMPQPLERWPEAAEIQAQGDRLRTRVTEIVGVLTAGDLDRPLPHLRPGLLEKSLKTPGDCLRMLSIHHTWHTAEINVLCRLQGRDRLL